MGDDEEFEQRRVNMAEAKAGADANYERQRAEQEGDGYGHQNVARSQHGSHMSQMDMMQVQQERFYAQIRSEQQQQNQLQADQQKILMRQMAVLQSAIAKPDLLTSTGVESWVIEEEIEADFPEPAQWCWPLNSEGRGRLEDAWEQNTRSRVWVYLTSLLPRPMWSALVELDVRGLYIALRTINRPNAISEGTALRDKLSGFAHNKKDKSMMVWFDELWECMADLDKLRQPVALDQVRQIIYAAVREDKRYADFKRDFSRNPNMDVNIMKAHLLEAARDCGDLVGVPHSAYIPTRVKKAVEQPPAGGKGKGGKGQNAHPPPRGPTSPAAAAAGGLLRQRVKGESPPYTRV